MARPEERGLKYYPFDVDFFNDEKIEAISGEFGIKGEIVAVKLLCAIYRNGYFIEWSDLYKMKLLRNLPGISSELLDAIIRRLVKWGFFNEHLFNSDKILTSTGIQRRYFEAARRRKLSGPFLYVIDKEMMNRKPKSQQPVRAEQNVTVPPAIAPASSKEDNGSNYLEELLQPTQLRDTICMRFSLTPQQLKERLDAFLLDCQCRNTKHQDRRDALNHFNDWLRIVIEAEKRKANDTAKSEKTANQANRRKGIQTAVTKPEDYNGTF